MPIGGGKGPRLQPVQQACLYVVVYTRHDTCTCPINIIRVKSPVQLLEHQPGRWPGLVGAVSGGCQWWLSVVAPQVAVKFDSVCLGPQGNSNILRDLLFMYFCLMTPDVAKCLLDAEGTYVAPWCADTVSQDFLNKHCCLVCETITIRKQGPALNAHK